MFRSILTVDSAAGPIWRGQCMGSSSMPELTLDLVIPSTFLDQVRPRRRLSVMHSLSKDVVSPLEHIGCLQLSLRISQQTVWEEREFHDNSIRKGKKADKKLLGWWITLIIIVGGSCSGSLRKAS